MKEMEKANSTKVNATRVSMCTIHKYMEQLPTNNNKHAGQTSMRMHIYNPSQQNFPKGENMNLLLWERSAA